MTSLQGDDRPDSFPQAPQLSNLEVRSTWSGNLDEPVDLRISLVTHCVPSTKLPLLNVKSARIAILKTRLIRLQSDESSHDNPSSTSSPQSPLFGFSSDHDGHYEAHGLDIKGPNVADTEASAAIFDEAGPSTRRNTASIPGSNIGTPSLDASVNLPSVAGLRSNFAKCEDWMKLQLLRKRSAAAACLTDSESGSVKAEGLDRKEMQSDLASKTRTVKSSQNAAGDSIRLNGHPIASTSKSGGKPDDAPSLVKPISQPERSEKGVVPDLMSEDHCTTASNIHVEELVDAFEVKGTTLEVGTEAGLSAVSDADKDIIQHSTSSVAPGFGFDQSGIDLLSTAGSMPSAEHETESTPGVSNGMCGQPLGAARKLGSTQFSSAINQETLLDSSLERTATSGESKPGINPMACLLPKLAIPQTPHQKIDEIDSLTLDGDHRVHSPRECEPEFDVSCGILFMKNPRNLQPATYKLVITISVFLREGKQRGWNELVIQGLPKLNSGECGFLLFRIPEKHGLEFRTTSLQRYKIVENCFMAEFSYTGDLVIPLRRCNRKFYGIVKDFTVHQEIRAEYVVASDKRDCQPEVQVNYHAICSVRLHNRCFWAEKCCLRLSIDGGPERSFHSKLESHKNGLEMIHITTQESTPIGISCLEIICSPGDLELFCVDWSVRLPQVRAISWLPRIYPASSMSCDRVRHQLRYTFENMEAVSPSPIERSCDSEKESTDEKSSVAGIADLENLVQVPPTKTAQQMESRKVKDFLGTMNVIKVILLVCLCMSYVLFIAFAFPWLTRVVKDAVTGPHEETPAVTVSADNLSHAGMVRLDINEWESKVDESVPTQDVEPAEEELTVIKNEGLEGPATDPAIESRAERTLTFRDKIDYWLGWRGPVDHS
ncbi:hypothetical protein BO94DRAFT_575376 [Aspergillus sclerotioniger CBS 115572]|uniref:Uncharacterized protein n=1 Tax=Aspergillus sclerotioniger CBS 115572 TaxID=1450535 RepID=A0A317WMK6_9EURO|nr:hypothetical protein BO94DRAFT_575376 [Aspergillus sclerotioniger CBS 115572]PWY87305.1 hypothetical protein BO94DRAFT_575376 [Aspergillus sclerotioniger CBS 115572]